MCPSARPAEDHGRDAARRGPGRRSSRSRRPPYRPDQRIELNGERPACRGRPFRIPGPRRPGEDVLASLGQQHRSTPRGREAGVNPAQSRYGDRPLPERGGSPVAGPAVMLEPSRERAGTTDATVSPAPPSTPKRGVVPCPPCRARRCRHRRPGRARPAAAPGSPTAPQQSVAASAPSAAPRPRPSAPASAARRHRVGSLRVVRSVRLRLPRVGRPSTRLRPRRPRRPLRPHPPRRAVA